MKEDAAAKAEAPVAETGPVADSKAVASAAAEGVDSPVSAGCAVGRLWLSP